MPSLPQCAAYGYIYDQAGEPAANVLVTLNEVLDAQGNPILLAPKTTLTDSTGTYHFNLPQGATAYISARASTLWNCDGGVAHTVPNSASGALAPQVTPLPPVGFSVQPPLSYVGGVLSIPRASAAADGYLHHDDFALFEQGRPPAGVDDDLQMKLGTAFAPSLLRQVNGIVSLLDVDERGSLGTRNTVTLRSPLTQNVTGAAAATGFRIIDTDDGAGNAQWFEALPTYGAMNFQWQYSGTGATSREFFIDNGRTRVVMHGFWRGNVDEGDSIAAFTLDPNPHDSTNPANFRFMNAILISGEWNPMSGQAPGVFIKAHQTDNSAGSGYGYGHQFWFDHDGLNLPNDPVLATHAATKNYVDAHVSQAITLEYNARTTSNDTTADPGNGNVTWNNATPSAVTELAFDDNTNAGRDVRAYLALVTAGSKLYLQLRSDSTIHQQYAVTSVAQPTGFTRIGVSYIGSNGTVGNNNDVIVQLLGGAGGGGGGAVDVTADYTWTGSHTFTKPTVVTSQFSVRDGGQTVPTETHYQTGGSAGAFSMLVDSRTGLAPAVVFSAYNDTGGKQGQIYLGRAMWSDQAPAMAISIWTSPTGVFANGDATRRISCLAGGNVYLNAASGGGTPAANATFGTIIEAGPSGTLFPKALLVNGIGEMSADPTTPLGIATKGYVDAHAGGGSVDLTANYAWTGNHTFSQPVGIQGNVYQSSGIIGEAGSFTVYHQPGGAGEFVALQLVQTNYGATFINQSYSGVDLVDFIFQITSGQQLKIRSEMRSSICQPGGDFRFTTWGHTDCMVVGGSAVTCNAPLYAYQHWIYDGSAWFQMKIGAAGTGPSGTGRMIYID